MKKTIAISMLTLPFLISSCSKEQSKKSSEGSSAPKIENNSNDRQDLSSSVECSHRSDIEQSVNDAKDAYEQALSYSKKDSPDYEKSRLYLLNAINHDPAKMLYYKALVDLLGKEKTIDSIRESSPLLKLAVYQVRAKDVAAIIAYQTKLDQLEDSILKNRDQGKDGGEELDIQTLAKALEDLKNKINEDKECLEPEELTLRMEIAQKIADASGSGEEMEAVYHEALKIAEVCGATLRVESYVEQLRKGLNLFIDDETKNHHEARGDSRLGRLNQIMQTVWLENTDVMPSALQKNITERYDKLNKCITYFNRNNDKPYMVQINAQASTLPESKVKAIDPQIYKKAGSLQKQIMQNQALMRQISKQAPYLRDKENTMLAADRTLQLMQENTELKRQQYVTYQKWAGVKLLGCLKAWDDEKEFNNDDAWDLFYCKHEGDNSSSICRVDSALLSPEVKKIYDEVIGFILDEDSSKKLHFKKELAMEGKKSLENY